MKDEEEMPRAVRLDCVRHSLLAYLGSQGFSTDEIHLLVLKLLTDIVVNTLQEPTVDSVVSTVEQMTQQWVARLRLPGQLYLGTAEGQQATH